MKGLFNFAWLVGLLLCAFSAKAQSTVESVRFWTAPDNTRLVFDVSEAPAHQVFLLDNPIRLVIDIADARLKGGVIQPPADHPLFSRLRSGTRNGRDLRFVIDLKAPVRPESFALKPNQTYGHRLVIDLFNQTFTAAKPVASMPVPAKPGPARLPVSKPAISKPVASERVKKSKVQVKHPDRQASRDVVVAIDAGHGGEDPGASGKLGTKEKDVVLSIASKLEALVKREPGMRPVMIRDGDYYVGLRKRMEIARKARADLFVSIHADAFNDAGVRGSSVFILSNHGASSEAARWLADSENASDLVGGVRLDDKDNLLASVLLDLSQTATLEASQEAAQNILTRIRQVGELHQNQVQNAGFAVLKSPDIPSLLVETAFISNPEEERNLRSEPHQERIARAVFEGIRDYFAVRAPPGTRLAVTKHVITEGETLSGIAALYGVSLKVLQEKNALDDSVVRIGQVLEIPADG